LFSLRHLHQFEISSSINVSKNRHPSSHGYQDIFDRRMWVRVNV
jgi:hypothetical protein